MQINRREFLKLSLAAGSLMPLSGLSQFAFANEQNNQGMLVVIFLRGGCDALNLVAPVNDKNYIEARVSDLRILDSGNHVGLPLANGLGHGLDFRMHHEASPLQELYQSGKLAIVHATGLTNGTRSHFEAQDLMERGVSTLDQVGHVSNGWLTRYIQLQNLQGQISALSASSGVAASLMGDARAVAIPDLQGGFQVPGGMQSFEILRKMYAQGSTQVNLAGKSALDNINTVDRRLLRQSDGKYAAYQPDNGAIYDSGNELSKGLQTIVRLMKMDVGLNFACVDHGGWDTHEGQPGRFNNQVGQLARNISAFYHDAARFESDLTIIVMSEFGRRVRSNRSQGTDHGHGGMMLVIGGKVRGGKMYGQWPGLETEQLDRGVDLAVTTDYRSVLAESLNLDSSKTSQVFPGFLQNNKIDLMTFN